MKALSVLAALSLLFISRCARAADPAASDPNSDHYGILGLLDDRSIYGKNWFPEPLRADEADVDNEVRFDWFHGEKPSRRDNALKMEFEKSFGLFTFEVAPSWESDRAGGRRAEGFGNIEFGARAPVFQYVSPNALVDSTFVLGLETTVPTHTRISRDVELVPKIFNLTRIGEHLSLQTGLGDSILVGPVGRGLSTLEYDTVFGYELTRQQLALPHVLTTTPIFELDGENILNQDEAGHNQLFGTAGFRFVLDSISWLPAQPKIGIGYTFPIDAGAREEFHWGVVTSLVFEY